MTEGLKTTSHQSVYIDSSLPCPVALRGVAVREYRGSVRRTRGLTLTVKNFMLSFSRPLLRNYRFFGLFPILFTQLPAMPLDTAGEKDKYDPSHSINNEIEGH